MKSKKLISVLTLIMMGALSLMTGCGNDMPYAGLDLEEYIEPGDYKGVEIEKVEAKVTKQEIGDKILEDLKAAAKEVKVKKGEPVKTGDTVIIDYVGKIEGKAFDGGSAKEQSLTLGSGSYIEGFESGLEGHEVGEKNIELNLAFPLDYSAKDLQGKDVIFTVDIRSATRQERPEFDDDFARSMGDYKSAEEYEAAVKKSLMKKAQQEAVKQEEEAIWSKVLGDAKVKKYPEDMIEHYMDNFSHQIDVVAEDNNTTRRAVMNQYYGAFNEKDLKKRLKDYAQTLVKQEMLIEYIAAKEDLTYDDKEKEALRESIIAQGYDEDSVELQTGRTMEQYLHIELLYEKVKDYLHDNSVIK